MSENDDLDNGLTSSLDYLSKIHTPFIGIANAQAELHKKLKPYQSMFEATSKLNRTGAFSGAMAITQMLQQQTQKWNKDYVGIIGMSRILQEQANSIKPGLMFASQLARFIPQDLPNTYISTLASLAGKHQHIFENSSKLLPILNSPIASQLTSMQIALNGISGTIAKLTAQHRQWDLMQDFETASNQAIKLHEELIENSSLSEKNETAFFALVDFVVSFFNRNKKVGIYALRFLEIIVIVATLHPYISFLVDKNDGATKQDIKTMETRLLNEISKRLDQENGLRQTNRICKVYLKPRTKSMLLVTLPKFTPISILQVHHKWVFVKFNDPRDNYAQTGWILKKYISL